MDNTKIKRKLLFIDDEQNCKELCQLLDSEYDITVVSSMEAAEDILKQNEENVNALLINAELQEDISKAVALVNNSKNIISIPILILADENTSADKFACLGSGVVDCISKPYNSRIITNRIANAIALMDSMTFYGIEKILKELPSNIFLKDNKCRYVFATKYWHHLQKPDDANWTIRGKTDVEIRKDKQNAIKAQKKDLEIIETGKGTTYTIEINEDGIQEFFQVIKQPIFNEDGFVIGIIGLINNTTEYELLKRKLQEKAITDELTGLYNRTYLDEFIKAHNEDCYPISIISADCDKLKEINDTYGHTAGDDYIKAAVSLFKMTLPDNSIIFRMGGDEFIIILPSTSKEEALLATNQLRKNAKLFHIEGHELSISFGVSAMNSWADGFQKCVAESDRNMYVEKKGKEGER